MKVAAESVSSTGITILYQPDDDEPVADIVFVHGLQGHPKKTWEHKAPSHTDELYLSFARHLGLKRLYGSGRNAAGAAHSTPEVTVLWPLDVLPADCPKARIITFGYDTRITRGFSAADKSTIFSHGRDLLYGLARERNTLGRSLVFVAHSLGGIIVKEALRESELSDKDDQKDILTSTTAVIFLGTPHRGSGMVGLGQIAKSMASTLLRMGTNDEILRSLAIDSSQIEICQRSFVGQWNRYKFQVKTFQEAKALTGVNLGRLGDKVVADLSSSFGDPREDTEKIQANHLDMCKFSGPDDPGYRKVGSEIKKFIQIAARHREIEIHDQPAQIEAGLSSPPSQPTFSVRSLPSYLTAEISRNTGLEWRMEVTEAQKMKEEQLNQQNACLRSLSFRELGDRQRDVEPAIADTCMWLLQNPTYRHWYNGHNKPIGDRQNLLWIKGKPGSGKSTLMNKAYQQAQQRAKTDSTVVAAFFFSARRNLELERTPLGLFRSLLHDLLQKDTALMAEFMLVYRKKRDTYDQGWQWQRSELQKSFRQMFLPKREGAKEIFIFIDALDECNMSEVRNVVHFFREVTAAPNLHVCLSSRHFPHISVPNCPQITVDYENVQDIEQYVQMKLSPYHHNRPSLVKEIVCKAHGVFLWVALVVNFLNEDLDSGKSARDIAYTLEKVPDELERIFSRLLKNLKASERQRAVNLVQWVLLAARPLTLRELRHTLAITTQPQLPSLEVMADSQEYIQGAYQLEKYVRAYSRGLIEVKKHDGPSIQEMSPEGKGKSKSEIPPTVDFQSWQRGDSARPMSQHELKTALYCGPFGTSSGGLHAVAEFVSPLLPTSQWISTPGCLYTSAPMDNAEEERDLCVLQFIHESAREFFYGGQGFGILDPIGPPISLAERHCTLIAACINYLNMQEIQELRSKSTASIIQSANPNFRNYRDLRRLIMNEGHSSKYSSDAMRKWIARHAYAFLDYSIKHLFYHAQQAESHGITPNSLLSPNHGMSFWQLWTSLQYPGRFAGDTTLLYAICEHNMPDSATSLLQMGTNANIRGGSHRYPLIAATIGPETDGNLDPEIFDAAKKASARGHNERIVRLLLDWGADPNLADGSGQTALHHAVAEDNPSLVSLLLDHRADVNRCDLEGRTPLHDAACFACSGILRLLIAKTLILDARDADGNTPLRLAEKYSNKPAYEELASVGAGL